MGSEVICTPVPEPPVKPATWPYDSTAEAYEQYFFDEVAGNDTSVKLGCTRARCHGGEAESSPPYIPARPDLSNAMVLTQAIDELWATIVVGGSKSETRLRSAHLAGGEAEDRYTYSSFEDEALYAFEQGTIECRWQATYAARPDGGGGCPDASVTDVGETADGGDAADGGVEAACECRLPVRDLSHCRSP